MKICHWDYMSVKLKKFGFTLLERVSREGTGN